VEWYESSKRKTKVLPNKTLAEHFRRIKYTQLNSDVFNETMTVNWQQMINEYRHDKKVAGVVEVLLYEVALSLRHFQRLVGKCNSRQMSQSVVDKFILDRGKEVKHITLNKDDRNLKAFINWFRENRYINRDIKLRLLKEDERPVKSLTNTQIKNCYQLSNYIKQ
jgi:hypothetical protein